MFQSMEYRFWIGTTAGRASLIPERKGGGLEFYLKLHEVIEIIKFLQKTRVFQCSLYLQGIYYEDVFRIESNFIWNEERKTTLRGCSKIRLKVHSENPIKHELFQMKPTLPNKITMNKSILPSNHIFLESLIF